jgi:hypothetical protein
VCWCLFWAAGGWGGGVGGGGGGGGSTVGIRVKLERDKIGLNQSLLYICPFPQLSPNFFICASSIQ